MIMPTLHKAIRVALAGLVFATVTALISMVWMVTPGFFENDRDVSEILSVFGPLLVWNLLPLAVGFMILIRTKTVAPPGWASVCFAVGVTGTTIYIHVIFILSYLGVLRGDANAVLGLFIFPMYQLVLSCFLGAGAMLFIAAKNHFSKLRSD